MSLSPTDRAIVAVRVTSRLAEAARERRNLLKMQLEDAEANLSLAVDVAEDARNELTKLAEGLEADVVGNELVNEAESWLAEAVAHDQAARVTE